MKMIQHETIGVNLPAGLGANFAQRGKEPFSVGVVVENRLAVVATIHHMINRTGIFQPQLPGHDDGLTTFGVVANLGTDSFACQ